jgi:hypothetical protein
MYSARLFLGFPITSEFSSFLEQVDPKVLDLFIKDEENYLKKLKINEVSFLGKCVDNSIDLDSLELLEANIFSLIKKLVPIYPYSLNPLKLFPICENDK